MIPHEFHEHGCREGNINLFWTVLFHILSQHNGIIAKLKEQKGITLFKFVKGYGKLNTISIDVI